MQSTKKMSNMDPAKNQQKITKNKQKNKHKNTKNSQSLVMGKQVLFLIKQPSCYS